MERSKVNGDFVLDSSVLIKWFSNEEDTPKALELREGYLMGNVNIASPDLILYEISNALRYNKGLSETDVKSAVYSLMSMDINLIVPTRKVIESAISIAYQFDITIYDAYFAALAKELKFTFVTADKKLYSKIKNLSFVKLLKEL